ncbi:MAG: type IV toxin-antitoxin system AbiEi family antitoxin [Desulfuromonadaceae bacterium]|nr:type IV toxin-antitoxin system AbiEi family antitoxin [Desulfuromonadaceae bacterium]
MKLIRSVVQTLNSLEDMQAQHLCDREAPFSGSLHLSGSWGQTSHPVCTAWRIDTKQARLLIVQLQSLQQQQQQPLLLADYVSAPLAQRLTSAQIQFLDATGNGFIHAPPLYFNRSGNKPVKASPLPNRCVQSAGLRVLYHLLQHPELAHCTYREISNSTAVALGSIGPVLKDLQRKKILSSSTSAPRRVLNHAALHQLWESSFLHKVRPRLQIERCAVAHPWNVASLPSLIKTSKLKEEVLLGGELAASFYCDQTHAHRATLHVERSKALKLMLQLRLTPDPDGCIDVVENFSPSSAFPQRSAEGLLLAEPYLVHAELMDAGEEQRRIAQDLARNYFPF